MKNKHFYIGCCVVLALCQACKPEEVAEKQPDKFCLTDTLKKNMRLDTVLNKIVENELVLNGKVTYDEDKVAKVYPLVGGFVQELRANLGDFVQRGQVLAVIRSPEIAGFANELSAAQSSLRLAEKNQQVAQELFKTGTISEVESIHAKKELETAQAELFRAKEVMNMYNAGNASFYNILAPASGFVVSKDITLNMELRTEDIKPIFVISNLDNVWVLANIYESDIAKIKVGYETDINTISYPDEIFNGKVDKIFNLIDPESKVLKARIVLENKDFKLKPEMFANVTVKFQDAIKQLAVPSKAVIFDKNKHFVMIYHDDCNIETREINIFRANTNTTYLQGGVKEGEKVMSKYQLLVYDALND